MTEQEKKEKEERKAKREKFNKLSIEDMKEYIENNAPEDKAWFKKACIGTRVVKDKDTGEVKKTIEAYNHLKAKRAFCERYMPELVTPTKEKQEKKTKFLEEW